MADLDLILTHRRSKVLPAIVSKLPQGCRYLGLELWTFFCDFHSLGLGIAGRQVPSLEGKGAVSLVQF